MVFLNEKKAKPKYNMAGNSWFMIRLAWTSGEKKVVVIALLAALSAVALNLIDLYVAPTVLAAVERGAGAGELLATIAVFILALMLARAAAAYIDQNAMWGQITVRGELIARLNSKVSTTSYPNLFDEKFQKLRAEAARATNGNSEATEAVWTTLRELTSNTLGFAAYAALLGSVQPMLMLVILATAAISYFANKRLGEWGYRHRDEEAEYYMQAEYLSTRAKDVSFAKDIRIFGLRPWIEELYAKALRSYDAFHKKAQGVYFWAGVVDLALSFLRNAVAYAYLIGLVINGGLTVPEFLLYFSAVGGFAAWVSGILGGLTTLHRQSLDLSMVREALEFPEPFNFGVGERLAPQAGTDYEIRLENVSFRYPGAERDTLRDINLTLRPGEKLAVVGLNGAGKTTLVKLICGFLDPTEGRVLLDGKDIREFDRADYYTMFSAVFQEFSLLAGSIATNVAQDEVGIDMQKVRECVEKAGLRAKIESLPDGYETKLLREVYEDAISLSGGETQRLMLARALYKDAPFIILDEPTAALDPIAESEMYQKYNELAQGRSSVYISHRLASTRFCDRIVMIGDGGICEQGSHEELLRLGGRYAELFEVQSRYYREEQPFGLRALPVQSREQTDSLADDWSKYYREEQTDNGEER